MKQTKIVPITEGDSEVEAVPILIRRWLWEEKQRYDIQIQRPYNTHGSPKLISDFERFLKLAQIEPDCAGILVLKDEEDNCAVDVAQDLAKRAIALKLKVPVVIICAVREYEAWFLASLATIAGATIKGNVLITSNVTYEGEIENKRDVKGWLKSQFPKGRTYKETIDQVALTQKINFSLARQNSRSFHRFEHALEELIAAIDDNTTLVTPQVNSE